MRIYHGSAVVVKNPEYEKGKLYNDYGRGFYCTEDVDLAREWSVDIWRDGYVNVYELNCKNLKVLNLNSKEHCILHWISILLQNRRFELDTPLSQEAYRFLKENYSPDLNGVDVIRGYRADDSYFSYAQDFVNGVISVPQLKEAMVLGALGEQIVLHSKKAFQNILYVGCEGTSAAVWYDKKKRRDEAARLAYREMSKKSYKKGELYMPQIIEQEVRKDDPRL